MRKPMPKEYEGRFGVHGYRRGRYILVDAQMGVLVLTLYLRRPGGPRTCVTRRVTFPNG